MQGNSVLSKSFFFFLREEEGSALRMLLQLPDGAATHSSLGFVAKGGLRNKCLGAGVFISILWLCI